MRLFTVDIEGKMIPYKQRNFRELYIESDLEDLLGIFGVRLHNFTKRKNKEFIIKITNKEVK